MRCFDGIKDRSSRKKIKGELLSLIIGCWLLVVGCWLLVAGC